MCTFYYYSCYRLGNHPNDFQKVLFLKKCPTIRALLGAALWGQRQPEDFTEPGKGCLTNLGARVELGDFLEKPLKKYKAANVFWRMLDLF